MRTLHSINTLHPSYGGPVQYVHDLTDAIAKMGHEPTIATLDEPDASWLCGFRAPVVALGPTRHYYRYSPRLVPWLDENVGRYDAVVVHGTWRYSSFGVWRALHRTAVPYFVFSHGMLDPYFRRFPLKELKKIAFWLALEHRVFRDAAAVLFTCEKERERTRNRYWPYRIREAVVRYGIGGSPTGSDVSQSEFLRRFPHLKGKRVLLFLGRLHPKKGCDVLLRAFALVASSAPSLHLVIAGPDEVGLRAALDRQARSLRIYDNVTFAGPAYGADKWALFHGAEAFVLSSHNENFSIAMAEALSCGMPVIVTNEIGVYRDVERFGAGYITNDSVGDFASGLRRYVSLSERERSHMRIAARRCFLDCFQIKAAAHSLINVIRETNSDPLNVLSALGIS